VFTVRSPAAVACALRAPRQLGIGRAYVTGLLEVDDLDAALDLLADWQPPPLHRSIRARLALAVLCAGGLTLPPPVPAVELRPRGRRHSPARDTRAVRHHHDLSNEFFALFLAPADRSPSGPASASSAAAGAASRSTLLPLAALRWSGSLCPSPRRASRSTVAAEGRRRPGRDPRDG
jgi:hypothetical protein